MDGRRRHFLKRFEGIADAIAAAEEDELLAIHHADRRRRPEAMPHPVAEVFGIGGEQLAGGRVERDETRRVGTQAIGVLVVHAIGGSAVKDRAIDQHRAGGDVVGANAQVVHEIVFPDDVAVGFFERHRRVLAARDVLGFTLERPVVAIGLAFHVQAQDLSRVGHHIHTPRFCWP